MYKYEHTDRDGETNINGINKSNSICWIMFCSNGIRLGAQYFVLQHSAHRCMDFGSWGSAIHNVETTRVSDETTRDKKQDKKPTKQVKKPKQDKKPKMKPKQDKKRPKRVKKPNLKQDKKPKQEQDTMPKPRKVWKKCSACPV